MGFAPNFTAIDFETASRRNDSACQLGAVVVRDGEIVIGRELPLNLSYDHRIVDGAAGRAFMAAIISALGA